MKEKAQLGPEFEAFMQRCWQIANDKGWNDTPDGQTFGDMLMLIVTELSEALEEYRNGHGVQEIYFVDDKNGRSKPEGIPVELGDVIVRLGHMCIQLDIPIVEATNIKTDYNETRPYLHGGKRL